MNGSATFVREQRYVVVKVKDLQASDLTQTEMDTFNRACVAVNRQRLARGVGSLRCVVVEQDWPEYEATWDAIERRESAAVTRDTP